MGQEAFDAFNDLKEAGENALEQARYRKAEKVRERMATMDDTWQSGPVMVTIDPASVYMSEIKVEALKDPKKFKKDYPKVYEALWENKYDHPSTLVFGRIDISRNKPSSDGSLVPYMSEGKLAAVAGVNLMQDVTKALKEIAYEIQNHKQPLSEVDYFLGISRLGSAAGHFGFDTYPLADSVERTHQSHGFAEEANKMSGMSEELAKKRAKRRPATLAVISKKELVELYGEVIPPMVVG